MKDVLHRIELVRGDITKQRVDAIVNAANSSLMGGGGVDGAIHRVGGPTILEECKSIIAKKGSCPTGQAVITTAGNLPAKYVIHTVGPVWSGGSNGESNKLGNCYRNSLQIAIDMDLKTIAFPNISTGIYGYPKQQAAEVAVTTVSQFLYRTSQIDKVYFVCFDEENFQIYQSLLQ